MRKNIVAGNWKMNTTLPEGIKLAEEVNAALAGAEPKCDVVICVPFTHLASINNVIDKNKLGLELKTAQTTNQAHTPVKFQPLWLPRQALPM